MRLSLPEKLIYIGLVAIVAGEALVRNPVHFHQTVQAAGYTMRVPMWWTPVKNPGSGMLVALRREWARSGTVDVMDRTAFGPKDSAWTMGAARHEQVSIVALQAKDGRFTNQAVLDLNAGKFTAVCEEASIGGNQALACYIVGTPLQFAYLGSASYEADAREMLASLK